MDLIRTLEQEHLKQDQVTFNTGDTVKVHVKV